MGKDLKNKAWEFFQIKEDSEVKKLCLLGLPVFEIFKSADYKRKRVKLFGLKFTFKTNDWKIKAQEQNLALNENNLKSSHLPSNLNDKNILFIASHFVKVGGIETRLIQYANKLSSLGWNVYILAEDNLNKELLKFTNFKLNFDTNNFDECLSAIIDKYQIKVVEFQFKNPKILKHLDLKSLKKKVKLGCVIHNLGVKKTNLINKFDYKIMVSKFMYEDYYLKIKNATVIKNCIDVEKYKNLPVWNYKNQRKALLVSRINKDKLKSIECFIKYCLANKIEFEIGGAEHTKSNLKNKLIKKYNLNESCFIGQVDTLDYLSKNIDNILFTAGVGLVMLEAGYLGIPCFVCSDYKDKNYSFVTTSNIDLFDNFTIKKNSLVCRKKKKEYNLDFSKIETYKVRDNIISNRSIEANIKKYLSVIEG